jgi:hypothetical protein
VNLQKREFGLTSVGVRLAVFQYAVENKLNHSFNDKTKIAAKDWFTCLLKEEQLESTTDFLGHERLEQLNLLCGFSGTAYRSPLWTLKGKWIKRQQRRIQYHEKRVAGGSWKIFDCGKY